jgi:hypothetical protein
MLGVLGATISPHLVVRVNAPVPSPIVTLPVTVFPYPELLCVRAVIWFPLYTNNPVVPELIKLPPE